MRLSESTTKNWMKIDPYYHRQKCRPLTLVSGDITFVRIFAGVLWRGVVKRQWGNRKRRFSWLLDATSSAPWEMRPTLLGLYSIIQSPVAFPVTPKWPWMTLAGYLALNSVFAPVWLADTARLRKIIAWKLIKIDTYCQQCISSAGTLVSGDIRFVRIFGRVLQKRDIKEQWGRSRVNARLALCANISKTVRDTSKVTIND